MSFIKTSLSIISLLFYCISLYYLFFQVESEHGSFYYYAYGYSVCWFLAAFLLGIFSNTTLSKVTMGLYISTLLLVSLGFVYVYSVAGFHKNAFDAFFHTLLLGSCNWLVALALPIRFPHVQTKKKMTISTCILLAGIFTYVMLRFLTMVWHIFRNEVGAHLIWLILGSLVMITCSVYTIKMTQN